jgi:hypothetical protein
VRPAPAWPQAAAPQGPQVPAAACSTGCSAGAGGSSAGAACSTGLFGRCLGRFWRGLACWGCSAGQPAVRRGLPAHRLFCRGWRRFGRCSLLGWLLGRCRRLLRFGCLLLVGTGIQFGAGFLGDLLQAAAHIIRQALLLGESRGPRGRGCAVRRFRFLSPDGCRREGPGLLPGLPPLRGLLNRGGFRGCFRRGLFNGPAPRALAGGRFALLGQSARLPPRPKANRLTAPNFLIMPSSESIPGRPDGIPLVPPYEHEMGRI